MQSLSPENPVARFALGATLAFYHLCPRSGIVEFTLVPPEKESELVPFLHHKTGPHVAGLPKAWQENQFAHDPEWLVQYKLASTPEPQAFQLGFSLRGSADLHGLSFAGQTIRETNEGITIETALQHTRGYRLLHSLHAPRKAPYLLSTTTFQNTTEETLTLEYLTSFSLGRLTPFDPAEANENLALHRFRSQWSAEGRHEARLLEDLNLERSWGGYSRPTERFGQAGSLPVRGFFPWVALEDRAQQTFWGAQLPAPGSWQLECSRRTDKVTLSGGLPSRDFGEWWTRLAPGESFTTPPAFLAAVSGDLDDLCQALVAAQERNPATRSPADADQPIIFNEWCTSWGEPSLAAIEKSLPLLRQTRTGIYVIDDGWAEKPAGEGIQCNGDWKVDEKKFPGGLSEVTKKIREAGMIPGLWFEMEVATEGTEAFRLTDRLLARGGRTIQVGKRHFWDFRDPETVRLLTKKVIERLRGDGFGYLKIDYNETLPPGVDGAGSPGAELLRHLHGVREFIGQIRSAVPDIIIENCSSGGHRLVPAFQEICDMGSFSDAHETWSIPIIAANLQRLIRPDQNQIWCVVHPYDDQNRLRYGLAATFLGRMALSGEIHQLAEWQYAEIRQAQDFLLGCRALIREGKSRLLRHLSPSWNAPRGWQLVSRLSFSGDQLLLVGHHFADRKDHALSCPLPPGRWSVVESYGLDAPPTVTDSHLNTEPLPEFTGFGIRLERIG